MEASSLQSARVLLLNSSYEPLRIIGWQRAMLLVLGQKIDVVDLYSLHIRSVSQKFQLPSVIRMKRYVRPKRPFHYVRFSRQHVFLRDDFRCQYCYDDFPAKDLTLDHVLPVMRGGRTSWSNIVTCCVDCNQRKGAKTPNEAGLELYKTPTEPPTSFIPDLLFYKRSMPESWRPYIAIVGAKAS